MPDHIHLCMDVFTVLPNGLSLAIAGLKGKISKTYQESQTLTDMPEKQPKFLQKGYTEKMPEKPTPFFSKGYNDRIAYSQLQWERQVQYTADCNERMENEFI